MHHVRLLLPALGLLLSSEAASAQNASAEFAARAARSRTPVEGTIQEGPGGSLTLVPRQDQSLTIPLAADQKLPVAAKDRPVVVQLETASNGARISSITLPVLTAWQKARAQFSRSPDLIAAMQSLAHVSGSALHVEANSEESEVAHEARDQTTARDLTVQLDRTEEQIISAYLDLTARAPGDAKSRKELVRLFSRTRRSTKSIYGRADNYSSSSYLRMHEVSKSAVAIMTADDQRVICSGVLVAPDLVLTAWHCLKEVDPRELRVVAGFEDESAGMGQGSDVQAMVAEGRELSDGARFDYVILKLKSAIPGSEAAAQCFSKARLLRDRPIYVIGHPEGRTKTIHDNSWVLFPFAATKRDYASLLMLVEAEFQDSTDRDAAVGQFRASYRLNEAEGMYQNFSVRFGQQPILAAETDTFHGDSGAPVFDRLTHAMVGIVVAGEEDRKDPWEPGWRRHEAVIPASQILADLDRYPAVLGSVRACGPGGAAIVASAAGLGAGQ